MSKFNQPMVKAETGETVEEVLKYPILPIEDRGISEATCRHFGVRSGFSESKGRVCAHYFPYTRNGQVVGFKKRDLLKPKKIAWSTIGDIDKGTVALFGQNVCQKGGYKLFVCEGEYDCLASFQTLLVGQEGAKKHTPNVTSVCFGAVSSVEQFDTNSDFIESYKEVILVFDNDDAGKEGIRKVAFMYPDYKSILLSLKDPCEVLSVEGVQSLYKQLRWGGKLYEPEDISYKLRPIEDLATPLRKGTTLKQFPKLNHKLQGLRGGEITFLLAPSGVGKTTFSRSVGLEMMKQGKGVDWMMLEEDDIKTQQSLLAMLNKVPIAKFRQNPSIVSREDLSKSYDFIQKSNCHWINSNETFGGLSSERVLQRVKWATIKGVQAAILDHITMCLYGNDKVSPIDEFVRELASIISGTETHLFVISHIRRTNRPAPKDREGNIKFPYWEEVMKQDARGSGAIEQLAWNIIVLEPEILNREGDVGRVRARVVKNREWGWLGLADMWVMDEYTGLLKCVEDDPFYELD